MEKSILRFSSLGLFAVIAVLMVTFTSCGDDAVPGCTDETASNYDSTATEDDGTCTYPASAKFLGDFQGSLQCPEGVIGGVVNTDSLFFTIAEGLDDNSVSITLTSGAVAGVNFSGTISNERTLTIATEILGYDLMGTSVDLGITGSADLSADDQTLNGSLDLVVKGESGATLATDTCNFGGTKI